MKKLMFLLAMLPCLCFGMIYNNVNDQMKTEHHLDKSFTCSIESEPSDYRDGIVCDLSFFIESSKYISMFYLYMTYIKNNKIIFIDKKETFKFDSTHHTYEFNDPDFVALWDKSAKMSVDTDMSGADRVSVFCKAICHPQNPVIPLVRPPKK